MLVVAVFIITTMTVLGVGLTKVLSTTNRTVAIDVLGKRAYFSAQSGMEIGLARLFPVSDPANPIVTSCFDVKQPIVLPNRPSFNNCKVSLDCLEKAVVEGEDIYTQINLVSNASCGDSSCSNLDECFTVNRTVKLATRINQKI